MKRNLSALTTRILVIRNQLVIRMKSTFSLFIMSLLILVVATGCSDADKWDTKDDDWAANEQDDKQSKDDDRDNRDRRNSNNNNDDDSPGGELGEALNEIENAFEELGQAFGAESKVEPIDFRDLRELLPERIRGMEKGRSNGERTGALGFRISQVEQTFEAENGDGEIEISIVDLGGFRNVASMGLDWLSVEVDRESDDGYERTRTYRGHPVMDKCEQMSRYERCELTAFISRRFVVSLKSKDVERGRLEDILEDIDIDKLEDMKDEGAVEG